MSKETYKMRPLTQKDLLAFKAGVAIISGSYSQQAGEAVMEAFLGHREFWPLKDEYVFVQALWAEFNVCYYLRDNAYIIKEAAKYANDIFDVHDMRWDD